VLDILPSYSSVPSRKGTVYAGDKSGVLARKCRMRYVHVECVSYSHSTRVYGYVYQ
jgi:hypothetical protein